MRVPLDEGMGDVDWQCSLARSRVHAIIDARCAQALRVIKAEGERDRRSLGQRTRWDRLINRINRRTP